jgi:tocopherol O-methyltransferase
MSGSPQFHVDIGEIRKHYDRLSRFYRMLWGEHLHHGYWEDNESIARAQIQLMEQLAEKAAILHGAHVLDIGCGLGGSAFWLAEQYDCNVTGLTISPVQARMATKKAKVKGLTDRVQFIVADANVWQPDPESVDVPPR